MRGECGGGERGEAELRMEICRHSKTLGNAGNSGKTLEKHWENTGKTLFLEGGELKYVPVCG